MLCELMRQPWNVVVYGYCAGKFHDQFQATRVKPRHSTTLYTDTEPLNIPRYNATLYTTTLALLTVKPRYSAPLYTATLVLRPRKPRNKKFPL
jgi:hypothetical protein